MDFKKGDHVILADTKATRASHLERPDWYPAPGTKGIVTEEGTHPYVQWEKGSTSGDDRWANSTKNLRLDMEVREVKKYKKENKKMEELTLDELIEKNLEHGNFEYQGETFAIGKSGRDNELCIRANDGGTSIGRYNNIKDKSTEELVGIVETDISNYLNGYISCSDCGKLIKRTEVAGTYFAGSYCKDCWEGKWKAIEAKETYD